MGQLLNRIIQSHYPVFATGGIAVFCFEIILTYVLKEYFMLWHMLAYGISLTAGFFMLFTFHRIVTFKKHDRPLRRMVKFTIVLTFIAASNWLIVLFLTESLEVYYLIAIIFVTGTLSVVNYIANKLWVFRNYG